MQYGVVLKWSDEDEAPELPGTFQEALRNLAVIIDEWIETAQKLGRSIPELKNRLVFA